MEKLPEVDYKDATPEQVARALHRFRPEAKQEKKDTEGGGVEPPVSSEHRPDF